MSVAPRHRRPPAAGFSLVEALVSLVVISVGMIGIAALYGQGLNAGSTALYRTVAVNLGADMADRIRNNRTAGVAYKGAPANNHCDPQHGPVVSCTPVEMAAHDLFTWKERLDTELPNAIGSLDYKSDTTPPTFTIDIKWQEPGLNVVSYTSIIQVPAF
ncbi:MAG TPA: type IV pilus modification protein PilV [Gammaproteobacteria bacterium]|nr:type IV pilus modification protein PilV [Gammaproteobacteria bacterium]